MREVVRRQYVRPEISGSKENGHVICPISAKLTQQYVCPQVFKLEKNGDAICPICEKLTQQYGCPENLYSKKKWGSV